MDTQRGARHRRWTPTIHPGRARRTISAGSWFGQWSPDPPSSATADPPVPDYRGVTWRPSVSRTAGSGDPRRTKRRTAVWRPSPNETFGQPNGGVWRPSPNETPNGGVWRPSPNETNSQRQQSGSRGRQDQLCSMPASRSAPRLGRRCRALGRGWSGWSGWREEILGHGLDLDLGSLSLFCQQVLLKLSGVGIEDEGSVLLEVHGPAFFPVSHLDQVVTVGGLDGLGDRAFLELEGDVGELGNEATAEGEVVEVATGPTRVGGVFRVLVGRLCEGHRVGVNLALDGLQLLLDLFLLGGRGLGVNLQQDMAGADLRPGEQVAVGRHVTLQLGIGRLGLDILGPANAILQLLADGVQRRVVLEQGGCQVPAVGLELLLQ